MGLGISAVILVIILYLLFAVFLVGATASIFDGVDWEGSPEDFNDQVQANIDNMFNTQN